MKAKMKPRAIPQDIERPIVERLGRTLDMPDLSVETPLPPFGPEWEELIMGIEDEFGFAIDLRVAERFRTFADIVRHVANRT